MEVTGGSISSFGDIECKARVRLFFFFLERLKGLQIHDELEVGGHLIVHYAFGSIELLRPKR